MPVNFDLFFSVMNLYSAFGMFLCLGNGWISCSTVHIIHSTNHSMLGYLKMNFVELGFLPFSNR